MALEKTWPTAPVTASGLPSPRHFAFAWPYAKATLSMSGGNVTITAGQGYTQTGSDILTPAGNIAITAQNVTINEARESGSQSTEQRFRQSGLTLAVTSPVISAIQGVQQQVQAAGNTQSSRMQALAAANAAMLVKQGAAQVQEALDKRDATGGAGISVSLGSSSSQSSSQSSADTARGSAVTAGGNIRIAAVGDGQNSNLTVQGSDIQALGSTSLKADGQVHLLAAQNTTQESSANKSSSASVGLAFSARGMGVTASASRATGQGAGNGTSFTNTQVEGGQQVTIQSGSDTTLKGATVTGNQVRTEVGGNLLIQSLQDQNRDNEKSQNVGGSVMIGAGGGGSLSVGQSKINSTYTSVGEQSAIRAGDGGFNVSVQGATTLTGGQITSTQAAIDGGKNSFSSAGGTTTTDLQNQASYSATSVSIGLGTGTPSPGAALSAGLSGVGIGSDKGSAASTTTAGISGIAGNTQARTGDKSTSLNPIFNKEQVQKEVAAQVAITSEFGKNATKAVGDYAKAQYDKAKAEGDQAGMDAWKEGGASRVALHTVVGGLTGGVQGAVGAASSQAVIDQVGQALKETNLPAELKQALVLAAGTAVGAATSGGSVAGAATAFNATANNYLSATDLRNRAQKVASCNGSSSCLDDVKKEVEQKSLSTNQKVIDACQSNSAGACNSSIAAAQKDRDEIQAYRDGLVKQIAEAKDTSTKAALQDQLIAANQSLGSVNNVLAQAKLLNSDGNYSTANLTPQERMNIGFVLDAVEKSSVKAAGKVIDTTSAIKANAAQAKVEQAAVAKKTQEDNFYKDGSPNTIINSNEVNARYEAAGKSAPYAPNTPVVQGFAPAGTTETQVISSKQQSAIVDKNANAIGNFSTTDKVPNQGYATGELAITTPATLPPNSGVAPFKPDVNFVTTIETLQPTPFNRGVVGPQPGSAGGGNQTEWLFSPGSKDAYIRVVPNSTKPLPPAPSKNEGQQ